MKRALLTALACALGLALVAFWPSAEREVRTRPKLEGAIVFDELQQTTLAPSSSP
jgi:hypothetical protein